MEREIPKLSDLEFVPFNEGSPSECWVWRIKGTKILHHPYENALRWKNGDWSWYCMNEVHRWDGPAMFWRAQYHYFIHDQKLSREEWEKHPQRLEWLRNQATSI